jgi:Flp pilus assembly protein TadD
MFKLTIICLFVSEVETDEVKEAKRLEIEGVKAAESGNIDKALELLNQAVTIAPDHASSYNNRAQALRLHGDVSGNGVPFSSLFANGL